MRPDFHNAQVDTLAKAAVSRREMALLHTFVICGVLRKLKLLPPSAIIPSVRNLLCISVMLNIDRSLKTTYPNQENGTAEELERHIRLAKNVVEKNRLLAIQMRWQSLDVLTISKILCVSDLSVYYWVNRFNSKGLDGLLSRYQGGRTRLVAKEAFQNLLNVFEEPQKAGQGHWTAKKFHACLNEKLAWSCPYRPTLNYLKDQGYKLKYGRGWPKQPEGNAALREECKFLISGLLEDLESEIWHMDESGFDGDPRPRRGWSKKGERKKIYRTQKHFRMNVSGMCCFRSCEFFALEFAFSDRSAFHAFSDVDNRDISPQRKTDYLVMNRASWHKVKSINWGRFKPIYIPPFSPDLYPLEGLWGHIKTIFFNSFCATNYDELIQH